MNDHSTASEERARARSLGIVVGALPTGPLNAITDVEGVLVGHTTLDDGADLHTGVTAVVPRQLTTGRRALPAAVCTGNGYGKLVGSTQVGELGVLESPIVLTATLSVFRAADALLTYLMRLRRDGLSFNPLVGETNDGFLSDIRRRPITERHVLDALEGASGGLPAEGCVGAGTGTTALGFKAGIGTSSRRPAVDGAQVTVGALVQANFGGVLTVQGVPMPVGELVPDAGPEEPSGNSCMIVVATDAALDARQLGRLARRAVFAMGRVGASYSNGSGDYAIAFSTAPPRLATLPDDALNPVFAAVMDSVEEALLNSLFTATTTTGVHGHTSHAVPYDRLPRKTRD
ncbi:P1 family peptidase [Nonomuraea sp. K274]|uniref:P1 family peptidase n=1 Tax=Nonomuraea cypriaca TaxID=1187855 RepID=A0A931A5P1_9ACTN|nr:P1 family peptidase [Nonomuraea cypriaca]MBF8184518.1 P1 family peptidase [Nonomuraea cypriaca]